jgi:protein-L-isoaspartate(D-aspartate) O-methyltransferase
MKKKLFRKLLFIALAAFTVTLALAAAGTGSKDDKTSVSSTPASVAMSNPGSATWSFDADKAAFLASGRSMGGFGQKDFQAVQGRKELIIQIIRHYLASRFGQAKASIIAAFEAVPREYYMYNYETGRNLAASAYETPIREWPIGYGSTLSDYLVQAYMTQALDPKPTDVSLEIGTGSGFQSSILSRIVKDAYSIEIITALGKKVQNVFPPLGYTNVHTRIGDGFFGWPEVEGGFDIIIVTAASPFVPPLLLSQLKKGGRMIIPIGQPYRRQFLYFFTKDEQGKVHSRKDISVLFIPMTGRVGQGG